MAVNEKCVVLDVLLNQIWGHLKSTKALNSSHAIDLVDLPIEDFSLEKNNILG